MQEYLPILARKFKFSAKKSYNYIILNVFPRKIDFLRMFWKFDFQSKLRFLGKKIRLFDTVYNEIFQFLLKNSNISGKCQKIENWNFCGGIFCLPGRAFFLASLILFRALCDPEALMLEQKSEILIKQTSKSLFSDQRNNFDFQEKTVPKSKQSKRSLRPL